MTWRVGWKGSSSRLRCAVAFSPSTMIFSVFAPLLLLPFASAGVHKLKLHKIAHENFNPTLETAYLSEKYGGQAQLPLMGAGGAGRQLRLSRPSVNEEGEDLFWTQEMINGGHNVPLSSKLQNHYCCFFVFLRDGYDNPCYSKTSWTRNISLLSLLDPHHRNSRSSWIRVVQTFGFRASRAHQLLASSMPSMTPPLRRHIRRMVPCSRFNMVLDLWNDLFPTMCSPSVLFAVVTSANSEVNFKSAKLVWGHLFQFHANFMLRTVTTVVQSKYFAKADL